ncbi:MAG: alpha/beta hydrolase, partial [Patescibacteria group bacterium]
MDIVLLHGWGTSSAYFTEIARLLAVRGFRPHLFDLPGFGAAPKPDFAWDLDDYVEYVREYAEKNNLARFFLLGHSFGGRIAIKFSLSHPERVAALVLYASAGVKSKTRAKNVIFRIAAKMGRAIFSLPGLGVLAGFFKKVLYRLAGSSDYLRAEGVMKEVMQNVTGEDLTPILRKISVPTFLVWGDQDTYTPLSHGMIMKENIPGA